MLIHGRHKSDQLGGLFSLSFAINISIDITGIINKRVHYSGGKNVKWSTSYSQFVDISFVPTFIPSYFNQYLDVNVDIIYVDIFAILIFLSGPITCFHTYMCLLKSS